jgi:hypothetical protein
MIEFMETLIEYFSENDVMPAIVTSASTGVAREGTYLNQFPASPSNCWVMKNYSTNLPSVNIKTAGIRRIQVSVRHKSMHQAMLNINRLFDFICSRMEPEWDWWIQIGTDKKYNCLFNQRTGPIMLSPDEEGQYIWALNIPITVNLKPLT